MSRLATWPLRHRLLASAVLMLLIGLPAAGWLLSNAFRSAVEVRSDDALVALARQVVWLIEAGGDGAVGLSRPLGDPRFERVHGGWYWQIEHRGVLIAASRSLWDEQLPADATTGPRGERLRRVALSVTVPGLGGTARVTVAGPKDAIDDEVAAFDRLLVAALGALGALLLTVLAVQVRWGLRPLEQMRDALRAVRQGERQRLALPLPADLAEVADALDAVLEHQQALIERSRRSAGDLAHALKQPLATLRLALEAPAADTPASQAALARLSATIDHHLARASAAGRAQGDRTLTRLDDALAPIVSAIERQHAGRPLRVTTRGLDGRSLRIEAQDLQELIGNLLDNAALAASGRVSLQVVEGRDGSLRIEVDDDGPGVSPPLRAMLPTRGLRLDESRPGSGLGLAIVQDLAALYGLRLAFEDSPLGGLRVSLQVPRELCG